jgi:Fic family protein
MSHQKVDMLKRIYDKNYTKLVESKVEMNMDLQMESAYHHNALEGNTLTKAEVKKVVEDGLAIGNKTLREHFEILNYMKAIEYLHSVAKQQIKLDEQVMKQVHSILMENIDRTDGGVYRTKDIALPTSYHTPPSHHFVQTEMIRLFEWYESTPDEHTIDMAVTFHCRLLEVHPFAQGNTLVAKLVLNFLLMKANYPCIFIPVHQREEYAEAIEKALLAKDYFPAIQLVAKRVEGNLAKHLLVG